MAAVRAHHAPDDAQHHCDNGPVLVDRDICQFRHRADHDGGRPAQHDTRFCNLCLPARHPQRRSSARSGGVVVHVPDPRLLRSLHPARGAQAREGNRMTASAGLAEGPRVGVKASLRRNRRWALIASYFFLILFAIFFLTPPYYMIVTSLKTDAEGAHLATNPWIMIGYFQSIPKELDEAALIDGAGHMQMLLKIFIPVALPGIIAATIFAFTVSWAAFVYPMAFLYSSDQQVLTVGTVTSLIRADVYKWGMLMAGALVAAAPPLVIYAFLMDYYIAGLTAGATKG